MFFVEMILKFINMKIKSTCAGTELLQYQGTNSYQQEHFKIV